MKSKVKDELCYKATAIQILGIAPKKFEQLAIQPTKTVTNPHYRSGSVSYLYNRKVIEALVGSPVVEGLKPKSRQSKDYRTYFLKRFQSKDDALGAGCEALFNLNRYCKYPSCSPSNRDEIYILKNRFIQYLHEKGYCTVTRLHHHVKDDRYVLCYCNRGCVRCDYTGEYLIPGRTVRFIVFFFNIEGKTYVWHQPADKVKFQVNVEDTGEPLNETEIKPLNIRKDKLSEAKALLRWILEKGEERS